MNEPGKKRRILIVDDEVTITRTLKLYLDATGKYEVKTENRGSQALEAAKAFKPDLVLLDVIMPDAQGGDVAAAIRADPKIGDTPVVFLTAIVSKAELKVTGKEIGGHTFLAKPVDVDELMAEIERQIAAREA